MTDFGAEALLYISARIGYGAKVRKMIYFSLGRVNNPGVIGIGIGIWIRWRSIDIVDRLLPRIQILTREGPDIRCPLRIVSYMLFTPRAPHKTVPRFSDEMHRAIGPWGCTSPAGGHPHAVGLGGCRMRGV
ncbi:hypothetical protein B0H13DRAFT_1886229 [Mycena leptocephala]|nr:hypothetical protein B0H13DRAFT_1886229 [Mycena leptocephala]